jgi:predicted enzyme related to lactoylglutathione lyase
MSSTAGAAIGTIGWIDLTVPNATEVRDFYRAVVGYGASEVEMGGYSDYCLLEPSTGEAVAGVCHARGVNTGLPPQWLIYITVEDVEASAARCVELGGKIISPPRRMGAQGSYCVIEDPAGAAVALFAPVR